MQPVVTNPPTFRSEPNPGLSRYYLQRRGAAGRVAGSDDDNDELDGGHLEEEGGQNNGSCRKAGGFGAELLDIDLYAGATTGRLVKSGFNGIAFVFGAS